MGVGKNDSSRSNRGSDSQTELTDRMLQQSLRVSWRRLAAEVDRVLEFRAFSLWTRAILEIEGSIPDEVLVSIEERCPGFGTRERSNHDLGSLWTDLLSWSEQFVFAESKAGGWDRGGPLLLRPGPSFGANLAAHGAISLTSGLRSGQLTTRVSRNGGRQLRQCQLRLPWPLWTKPSRQSLFPIGQFCL
jgi:hypothetical protein